MQAKAAGSVFELLAKPVRKALANLGFTEPTLPQTLALPLILDGKNVLLIAPTGTGKTEAVLLPIFSKLVEEKNQQKGIQVIYNNRGPPRRHRNENPAKTSPQTAPNPRHHTRNPAGNFARFNDAPPSRQRAIRYYR